MVRPPARARARPAGHRAGARATRASSRGTTCPTTTSGSRARLQEAFAAFLDHTDDQIGRLIDELEALGELDNTLIFVLSDNGASQEGGPFGVLHEMKFFNFLLETPDEAVDRLDDIGGPNSHSNYPWGWAQAGNTPFKWYKQNTHEGGVHVPLHRALAGAASPTRGGLRRPVPPRERHRAHDLRGARRRRRPTVYRGLEQMPVTGHVDAPSSFAAPDAPRAASTVQYFEMMGHRGIYADGWKAVTRHQSGRAVRRRPLGAVPRGRGPLGVPRPGRRRARAAGRADRAVVAEAEEHGVLPLDDRTVELFGARFRDRSPHRADRHYTYRPPMSPLPAQVGAAIGGRSWDLDGHDRPRRRATSGVLYATGTENSGISVFVQDDRLVFDYNVFGDHHVVRRPSGRCPVGRRWSACGSAGPVAAGTATLVVDGAEVGSVEVPVRHAHDLERGRQRGLRPRLPGEHGATTTRSPSRGDWSEWTSS